MNMPQHVHARNVNDALPLGVQLLNDPHRIRIATPRTNIGGSTVIEVTSPVITTYTNPMERVLFDNQRDANPFFHFFESLWILAGRSDVAWLKYFLPSIAKVSDDGMYFHGGYGERMRDVMHDNGRTDQLQDCIDELKRNPESRRAVAGIWQPIQDSGYTGLDMPCNCTVHFQVRDNKMNMTVFNRSNDMIWGAYGANAVQFAFVLEYMAARVGVEPGTYYQISNNFHVYLGDAWDKVKDLNPALVYDPYTEREVFPYKMISHPEMFDDELRSFMSISSDAMYLEEVISTSLRDAWRNKFFAEVADPMFNAFYMTKHKVYDKALMYLGQCKATDWKLACEQWIQRRVIAAAKKVEA